MSGAAFSACYADWKLIKTRACVQIVLEIPIEKANEAYTVLGGMPVAGAEVWCGVARLDPNKVGVATPREAARELPAPREPDAASHRLIVRAAMLCKDPLFHKFVETQTKWLGVNAEAAATYLRERCEVTSRSEILPGTTAATRLDFVESAFIGWRDKAKFVEAAE